MSQFGFETVGVCLVHRVKLKRNDVEDKDVLIDKGRFHRQAIH